MGGFEPGTWSWPVIVSVLVAVVVGLVCVWATRRWGTRRGVLTVRLQSNPIVRPGARIEGLEVTYRGLRVEAPYSVELVVSNTGGADISTSAFDAGRPIRIRLGRQFFGVTETTGVLPITTPAIGADPDSAVIEIGPGLLKRGASEYVSLVVSGEPQLNESDLESPLIDVKSKLLGESSAREDVLDAAVLILQQQLPLGGLASLALRVVRAATIVK